MSLVKQIQQFLEDKILKVLTQTSLTFTYFLGIGLTSIVGKIVNKKFLPSAKKSSWQKANYMTDIKKMF